MDLGPLRALTLSLNQSAHGVPATVTRPSPDNTPIDTRVIWLTNVTDGVPANLELQRRDPHRVMVLSRAEVPTVPRGTYVMAPEKAGDATERWRVDGTERVDADVVHVTVVRDPV